MIDSVEPSFNTAKESHNVDDADLNGEHGSPIQVTGVRRNYREYHPEYV